VLAVIAQELPAQVPFTRPPIDWHAFAPELVLLAWGALVTVIDLVGLERARRFMPSLTGIGFLLAMIPVLTLWDSGETRVLFQGVLDSGGADGVGAYVVDQYSLVLKGVFLLSGYVVVLLSTL
jgi:NADH-quinone oxidoreductase subunit N